MAEESQEKLYGLQTLQDYAKLHDCVALMNDFASGGPIYREIKRDLGPDIDVELRDSYGRMNVNTFSRFVKKYSKRYGHLFGMCANMKAYDLKQKAHYARELGAEHKTPNNLATVDHVRQKAQEYHQSLETDSASKRTVYNQSKDNVKAGKKEVRKANRSLFGKGLLLGLSATVPVVATGMVGAAAYQIVASALTTTLGIASGGAIAVGIAAITLGPKIISGIGKLIAGRWEKLKSAWNDRKAQKEALKEAKRLKAQSKKDYKTAQKQYDRLNALIQNGAYPALGLNAFSAVQNVAENLDALDMTAVQNAQQQANQNAQQQTNQNAQQQANQNAQQQTNQNEQQQTRQNAQQQANQNTEQQTRQNEQQQTRQNTEQQTRQNEQQTRQHTEQPVNQNPQPENQQAEQENQQNAEPEVSQEERVLELCNAPEWADLELFKAENDIPDDEWSSIISNVPAEVLARNNNSEPDWVPYASALSESIARTPEDASTKDLDSYRSGSGFEELKQYLPEHLSAPGVPAPSQEVWNKVKARAVRMATSKAMVRESLQEKLKSTQKANKKAWVDYDLYQAENGISKEVMDYAKGSVDSKYVSKNEKNKPSRIVSYSDAIIESLRESGVDGEINLEQLRSYDGSMVAGMERYLDESLRENLSDAAARKTGDFTNKFLVSDEEWKQIKNRVRAMAKAGAITTKVSRTVSNKNAFRKGQVVEEKGVVETKVRITPEVDKTPVVEILNENSPELLEAVNQAINEYSKTEDIGASMHIVEAELARQLQDKGFNKKQIYDLLGEAENDVRAKIAQNLYEDNEKLEEALKNEKKLNVDNKKETQQEEEQVVLSADEIIDEIENASENSYQDDAEQETVVENTEKKKEGQKKPTKQQKTSIKRISKGVETVDKILKDDKKYKILEDLKTAVSKVKGVSEQDKILEEFKNNIAGLLSTDRNKYTREEIDAILTAKDEDIEELVNNLFMETLQLEDDEYYQALLNEKSKKQAAYVAIKVSDAPGTTVKQVIIPKELAEKIETFIDQNKNDLRVALNNDEGLQKEIQAYLRNAEVTPLGLVSAMSQPLEKDGVQHVPTAIEALNQNTNEVSRVGDKNFAGKVQEKQTAKKDGLIANKNVGIKSVSEYKEPVAKTDSNIRFPNLVVSTRITKKEDGTKSVSTSLMNKTAVDKIKARIESGELKDFKAKTIVKVTNEDGKVETKNVTLEEKQQLVNEGKVKTGPARFKVKGGAKKIVTMLDSQHLEDIYNARLKGQSKLKKGEKIDLLKDCVRQLSEENPNIRPEIIASQLLTYAKATAKTVYDRYKVEITAKDIIPESPEKVADEKVNSENAGSASGGGGSSGGTDGNPVAENKKVAEANKDEVVTKATNANDEARDNKVEEEKAGEKEAVSDAKNSEAKNKAQKKKEEQASEEKNKKEAEEQEQKVKENEEKNLQATSNSKKTTKTSTTRKRPSNSKKVIEETNVKTDPSYPAINGYQDILLSIKAGKYVDVEKFMKGKFDETDKQNIRTWLEEEGYDKQNESNKLKQLKSKEKTAKSGESKQEKSQSNVKTDPNYPADNAYMDITAEIKAGKYVDVEKFMEGKFDEADKENIRTWLKENGYNKLNEANKAKEAGVDAEIQENSSQEENKNISPEEMTDKTLVEELEKELANNKKVFANIKGKKVQITNKEQIYEAMKNGATFETEALQYNDPTKGKDEQGIEISKEDRVDNANKETSDKEASESTKEVENENNKAEAEVKAEEQEQKANSGSKPEHGRKDYVDRATKLNEMAESAANSDLESVMEFLNEQIGNGKMSEREAQMVLQRRAEAIDRAKKDAAPEDDGPEPGL